VLQERLKAKLPLNKILGDKARLLGLPVKVKVTVTLPAEMPMLSPEAVAVIGTGLIGAETVIVVKVQDAEVAKAFAITALHPVGTLVSDPLLMVGTEVKSIYPDLF
jgi:hypothetical protein